MRALFAAGAALVVMFSGVQVVSETDPDKVHFVLPQDAIPAITRPRFLEDPDSFLGPDDLVIGVEIGGDAKAYPIAVLNWHEVANDVVGGRPVAVTWCPLCYTAMVFGREVEGDVLTFRVSGKLYRNNLVMADAETGSLWSQEAMEAIDGPLQGARLELLGAQLARWEDWRARHPGSKVLEPPGTRSYGLDPYEDYARSPSTLFPVANADARLHPKAIVFGVELGGEAKAYALEALRQERVVNDKVGGVGIVVTQFKDMVNAWRANGTTFRVAGNATMRSAEGVAYDMLTGEPLEPGAADPLERVPGFVSFWFAWADFHPGTALLAPEGAGGLAPSSLDPRFVRPFGLLAVFLAAYGSYKLWTHLRRPRRGAPWRGAWFTTRGLALWGLVAIAGGAFAWLDGGAQVRLALEAAERAIAAGLFLVGAALLGFGVALPRARLRETALAPAEVAERVEAGLRARGADLVRDEGARFGPFGVEAGFRWPGQAERVEVLRSPGTRSGLVALRAADAGRDAALRGAVEEALEARPRPEAAAP